MISVFRPLIGKIFPALLLAALSFQAPASASDLPFVFPANQGETGMLEMPTARVMRENRYRLGITLDHPYRYYYVTVTPINGLEVTGRITQIMGVRPLTESYGNFKDKNLDFKYQIMKEGKYMPALAIGILDPLGTRHFAGQYIAASKQIYPFDFTLGMGNGRFGRRPLPASGEAVKMEIFTNPKQWLRNAQFFGGVQFAPSKRYALVLEYSPILYNKQTNDPAQSRYFKRPVPSKFNLGVRYKPTSWTELDLSLQRGNNIAVAFSMPFHIGRPMIPIYDYPYYGPPARRALPERTRLEDGLASSGFSNIKVLTEGDTLCIDAQNNRWFYTDHAIGVILDLVYRLNPGGIKNIRITLTRDGIPMVRFITDMPALRDFNAKKLTLGGFIYLSKIETDITHNLPGPAVDVRRFRYMLKPSLETFLNDPSGFFKYRIGTEGSVDYYPWKGGEFTAGLATFPINNIKGVNEPFSVPVRSDIALYKKDNVSLNRLMYNQVWKFPREIYGRAAAGYLEVEYAGFDTEVARPFFGGRLVLGASGTLVKKRRPGNLFLLKRDDQTKPYYTTAFLNVRVNIPEYSAAIDLKNGKFLAGDTGTIITLSKFINGVVLSVWYSFTDTSVFRDRLNRGYHEKGVSVAIPIRLFKGRDSRTVYYYGLSPWTRDVAQDIDHYGSLFDLINRDTKILLDRDMERMY